MSVDALDCRCHKSTPSPRYAAPINASFAYSISIDGCIVADDCARRRQVRRRSAEQERKRQRRPGTAAHIQRGQIEQPPIEQSTETEERLQAHAPRSRDGGRGRRNVAAAVSECKLPAQPRDAAIRAGLSHTSTAAAAISTRVPPSSASQRAERSNGPADAATGPSPGWELPDAATTAATSRLSDARSARAGLPGTSAGPSQLSADFEAGADAAAAAGTSRTGRHADSAAARHALASDAAATTDARWRHVPRPELPDEPSPARPAASASHSSSTAEPRGERPAESLPAGLPAADSDAVPARAAERSPDERPAGNAATARDAADEAAALDDSAPAFGAALDVFGVVSIALAVAAQPDHPAAAGQQPVPAAEPAVRPDESERVASPAAGHCPSATAAALPTAATNAVESTRPACPVAAENQPAAASAVEQRHEQQRRPRPEPEHAQHEQKRHRAERERVRDERPGAAAAAAAAHSRAVPGRAADGRESRRPAREPGQFHQNRRGLHGRGVHRRREEHGPSGGSEEDGSAAPAAPRAFVQ